MSISSKSKIQEKDFGAQTQAKGAKIGSETRFPRDFEIVGWRPAGPVLPHREVPL